MFFWFKGTVLWVHTRKLVASVQLFLISFSLSMSFTVFMYSGLRKKFLWLKKNSSHSTYVMWLTEIFSLILRKNCLRSKIIKLNKFFTVFKAQSALGNTFSSFKCQDHFLKWQPLFLTPDSKRAGNFTLEMIL